MPERERKRDCEEILLFSSPRILLGGGRAVLLEELMTNTGRVICKQLEWEQGVERSRDLTRMLSGGFFLERACKDVHLGVESRRTSSQASEKRKMDVWVFGVEVAQCGIGSVGGGIWCGVY